MRNLFKKGICCAAAAVLAAASLAGCSDGKPDSKKKADVKNASDVLAVFADTDLSRGVSFDASLEANIEAQLKGSSSAEDLTDYGSDTDSASDFGAQGGSMSLTVPIKLDLEGETFGGEMHAKLGGSMSFMGEEQKVDYEMYLSDTDSGMKLYSYDGSEDNASWVVSDASESVDDVLDLKSLSEYLNGADFKKSKSGYVLTKPLSEIVPDDEDNGGISGVGSSFGVDADLGSVLDGCSAVFEFDNQCRLVNVKLSDGGISYEGDVSYSGTDMHLKADVNFSAKVRYGNVDGSDVAVPGDVSEGAQEEPGYVLDEDFNSGSDEDASNVQLPSYFSLGEEVSSIPCELSVFTDNGWSGSGADFVNNSCPGALLTVYGRDKSEATDEGGVYEFFIQDDMDGFDVEFTVGDSIGIGSTLDDAYAVFGSDCVSKSSGDGSTSYTYNDGDVRVELLVDDNTRLIRGVGMAWTAD